MDILESVFHEHQNNSPNANGKHLLVFYVTGNPGSLEFIVDFLKDFHNMLVSHSSFVGYSSINLYSSCHMNHNLRRDDEAPLSMEFESHGLQSQIDFHKDIMLNELRKQSSVHGESAIEIMLVGHSIGSYMILDIIDTNPRIAAATKQIILLAPFLFWSRLPSLHRFALSLGTWRKDASIAFARAAIRAIWSISDDFRAWLIYQFSDVGRDFAKLVATRLLTLRFISNFLEMGYDEIMIIPKHEQRIESILRKLTTSYTSSLLMGIYTTDDKWAPLGDYHHLRSILPSIANRLRLIPNITHAFTLAKHNYCQVSAAVSEILNQSHSASLAQSIEKETSSSSSTWTSAKVFSILCVTPAVFELLPSIFQSLVHSP